jgi:hypothetical protein
MSHTRRSFFKRAAAAPLISAAALGEVRSGSYRDLPIRIDNPRRLGVWTLPAERIPVGIPNDYKPNLALLPGGELLMFAVFVSPLPNKKQSFETHMWRSRDGGLTWSERKLVQEIHGHEPYVTCTSKGTLLVTTTVLKIDPYSEDEFTYGGLFRSTDGGRTWTARRVMLEGSDRASAPRKNGTHCSRHVFEMPDGTLLLGVSIQDSRVGYLWRSGDEGASWEKTPAVTIGDYRGEPYDNLDGFFSEDFTYPMRSGKILHFIRCGPPSPMYPMRDGRTTPATDDSGDRSMLCDSGDGGKSWSNLRDFGDYGLMYPRVLRLRDGRLLLTCTQRAVFYPIGLRACVSYDDGETWDLTSDRIILEGKSPWGAQQGGGFGNTVQLPDGSLVSCSSYRGLDAITHVEVIRWTLPHIS